MGINYIGGGASFNDSLTAAAEQIFKLIDIHNRGFISIREAENLVIHLNSRLSCTYGDIEVKSFFAVVNEGAEISIEQFLAAFNRLANDF